MTYCSPTAPPPQTCPHKRAASNTIHHRIREAEKMNRPRYDRCHLGGQSKCIQTNQSRRAQSFQAQNRQIGTYVRLQENADWTEKSRSHHFQVSDRRLRLRGQVALWAVDPPRQRESDIGMRLKYRRHLIGVNPTFPPLDHVHCRYSKAQKVALLRPLSFYPHVREDRVEHWECWNSEKEEPRSAEVGVRGSTRLA